MSYIRENLRKPLRSHIDYNKYFPQDIVGSNIDFIIERHGEFLVVEFKGKYEKLPEGQRILLKALARMPNFTVLLYSGEDTFKLPDFEQIGYTHSKFIDIIRTWMRARGLR